MTRRLAWVAAAPLLALAVLASATYTLAVTAANTVIDYGAFDDEDEL
ncbi:MULTISPECIES: hypothetical protein [Pseudonocardia]|uniref:Uncharacterized protein n=2 Tax=Pseudonocardia TaxID=1847 RepID=A0A1Y2MLR2_PSEAH|nr:MULTISPECIES: hypothetical protein [Pseudonocardia]OSY36082.1 hypothetical protein BG845_05597 [Pseudonocardia autotrophica]TDN77563.1 hypothetical protein C8E95_6812 [Pseudonocardia autotrophica]BBG01592.1 hypothetical protein Pdca_28010 [Pseudonocardia autotrophica]GEC25337.1 hypothetical protein PSA01_23660 [Pseudonocardia saturnea]